MALDKGKLKNNIHNLLKQLQGSNNRETAMSEFSAGLADAIDSYVKSATIVATPTHVTAAAMTASTFPVVAANNLVSEIG